MVSVRGKLIGANGIENHNQRDPQMTTDLSKQEPATLAALWSKAETAFDEEVGSATQPEMTEELVEELKMLGYLD